MLRQDSRPERSTEVCMNGRRVAVVAGARTPFVRAGKGLAGHGPLALAKHATMGLLERHEVDPSGIEAIAFGVDVPEPHKPNLAREIVLEGDLPRSIEAQTVSSYCITGLRTVAIIHDAIATGRIEAGIAGGTESLSHSDVSMFKEPSTGLTMGQHMELTVKEWKLPRDRQDEIALASHVNAVAARDKLAGEIIPIDAVERDSGPRDDTSLEALAGLQPVFAEDGTITAGNASPVTDGAAAVLLMSEERARADTGSIGGERLKRSCRRTASPPPCPTSTDSRCVPPTESSCSGTRPCLRARLTASLRKWRASMRPHPTKSARATSARKSGRWI